MTVPEPLLEYGATPDEEHHNIRRANQSAVAELVKLGRRLRRFRDSCDWQKLTIPGAPFPDFSTYLVKGVGISPGSAYRAMDAAQFPLWVADALGIERAALLKRITDFTVVDETPEQAMALVLPVGNGASKPVTEMTVAEMNSAYRLVRDGEAAVQRPDGSAPSLTPARALQQAAAAAVAPWLQAGQVRAHRLGEGLVLDLHDVPQTQAPEVFAALAAALREG